MKIKLLFYQLLNQVLVCLLVLLGSTVAFTASAQCPIAAGCTPGGAPASNHIFGMGIMNVTFGSINNSTGGVTEGYQDISCTQGTALTAGVSYPISISTNTNVNENVRVWIDYNNNGQLDAISELAFLSDNKKLHTGNITIPASAVTGTPLRIRISADYITAQIPTPCSTPQYSQVEDYSVTVHANSSTPDADFSADLTTTCTGSVTFSDLSQNLPTSWSWNFGDGNSSSQQNPTHNYATPGTYTVSLIACNAAGCDTITKTNYITYNHNVPRAATCTPATSNYCCNYGITNFTFDTLNNASANGSTGYEDFTCTKAVTVTESKFYPTSITTGTANNHDVRIYIDYNNDGAFAASELVYEALNTTNPSGSVIISGGAVLNTPLRMRVIADFAGSTFTGCSGVTHGQAEDYTITILQNTNPPTAQFTSDHSTPCDTIVQFTDETGNITSSWKWYFGDGDSSSLQNPVHEYTSAGIYNVTLIACNSFGCDTIVKNNFITITLPCYTYCSSNGHNNRYLWITNVQLNGINNTSSDEPNGYGDYTTLIGSVTAGASSPITITTNNNFPKTYTAWLDYDRNGIFDAHELIVADSNNLQALHTTFTVPSTALSGPTRLRISTQSNPYNFPAACFSNMNNAEVEDYTIYIGSDTVAPVANFYATPTNLCDGFTQFTDQTINGATSWFWEFGDGDISTLQNPTHIYNNQGAYAVSLTVCNTNGCNTTTKQNYITYDTLAAVCNDVSLPDSGKAAVITWCSGNIYDSGGPNGNYTNNEDGIITIAPPNTGSIRLDFTSFDLQDYDDRLFMMV